VNPRAAATPIALLVLAAGTVAYAYFVDRGTVSDADRDARRKDIFPSFRVDHVSRVEIDQGSEGFVLEREPDAGRGASAGWVLSPRQEYADPVAVDALLRELELATRLREVTPTGAMGLDAPRARGKVKIGALEYRFEVGADAPRPEGGAYMRVNGEPTFVVGRSLKVQLLRGADAYRDRTLIPLGAQEIARLDVRAADGPRFVLERHGASFELADKGLRVSRSAAARIFTALAEARAESFLDGATAKGLAAGGITVTLTPRDEKRPVLELRIGGACPGQPDDVAVVRTTGGAAGPSPEGGAPPAAACTARTLVEALGATAESLVDWSPIFAHADEIEQIRLEAVPAGLVVDLARKASGWHERAPDARDLDRDESDSANNLALALASARALDERRGAAGEGFAVRDRVTVVRTGDGASEVVELDGQAADGTTLARRADDGAVLRLSRSVARRFEPHAVALRSRSLWRPAFDAGAVVAIDDGCTRAAERIELRDGTWSMRAPAGFATDASSIVDRTGAIAHAKADEWIAERDDGSFGFDGPASCTVTLTLGGEPRRVSLVFGAEGDDGVYAHLLGDPAVFVATRKLRDLVSRPAIDRSRLRLDPSALARVTLAKGTSRLVLERSGDRWLRLGQDRDAARDDDPLPAALEDFYALSALHTGPPGREEGLARPSLEIVARSADADARPREIRISLGAEGQIDGQDIYFARASGIDATFAVPRRPVSAILDAW
jgi:uncharacterized protein DUF4340